MFDQLKDELRKRNEEKQSLEEAVRRKEEELAAKRQAAKKSVLRKIKPIDSIKSKSEQKHDAKEIEQFRAQINEEISAARSNRSRQLAKNNAGKIAILAGVLVLALILLIVLGGGNSGNKVVPPDDESVAAVTESEDPVRAIAETPEPTPPGFRIRFIDVGEGDAALVESDGHYMLIDGGNPSQSSKIYSILESDEITELDYIICTHVHEDHSGGLAGALNYASVGTALCSSAEYDSRDFNSFVRYLEDQDKSITIPQAGDTFTLGSADVEILGPTRVSSNENCNSIVLRITYGETSFLFAGDAELEEENDILASDRVLKSTVLKIGHHGSDTSTSADWLAAVAPEYAVISVGAKNEYGHPADLVLARLSEANVTTYRTDLQGDITCVSNGKQVEFSVARNPLAHTLEPKSTPTPEPTPTPTPEPTPTPVPAAPAQPDSSADDITKTQPEPQAPTNTYVVNVNTGKFHYPWCSSVSQMNESNKVTVTATREEMMSMYSPCQRCNP